MRFNGVELRQVHRALSINKEIPPGMAARNVLTVSGAGGERVVDVEYKQAEYTVIVNIACRTRDEGWRVREKLAAWATSSGRKTAELEPTHMIGRAYDAIVKEISDPEFIRGFAVVTVRFLLPRPFAHSTMEDQAEGDGKMHVRITGTAECRPVLVQTLTADVQDLLWTMDGRDMLRVLQPIRAGTRIEANFENGSLLLDGVHQEARVDAMRTTWHPGFTPGAHEIQSSGAGRLEMRWRAEWQ